MRSGKTASKKTANQGGRQAHFPFWKNEKLYFKGDDYFLDLLKSIQRAKKSVDFETYIFEPGNLGDKVVAGLLKAAKRGVRVRLLVDGVGSPDFAAHYGSRFEKAGVSFRVYRSWPVFFSNAFRLFHIYRLNESIRRFRALFNGGKHRDHRKLCVVDENEVWIGSFNVSDWHLQSVKGKETWRDTGIRLVEVTSFVFRVAFLIAWEDPWPRRRRRKYRNLLKRWVARDLVETPIRLTITRRLRVAYRRELLARFRSARKRIWVLSPYFSPTHSLLMALAHAAREGRDVQLILPALSDVPVARWAAMTFYPTLLKAGCRIYEYQKSVLHAKSLLIDSWVMAGSSNLDQRSLRKDLEVNVVLQEKRSREAVERQYGQDRLQCREVTMEDFKHRPLGLRFLSWLFFRFRFWF